MPKHPTDTDDGSFDAQLGRLENLPPGPDQDEAGLGGTEPPPNGVEAAFAAQDLIGAFDHQSFVPREVSGDLSTVLGGTDEETMRGSLAALAQSASHARSDILQMYEGPMGWLKNELAKGRLTPFTRQSAANGQSVEGEAALRSAEAQAKVLADRMAGISKLRRENLALFTEAARNINKLGPKHPQVATIGDQNADPKLWGLALMYLAPQATAEIGAALSRLLEGERDRLQRADEMQFESQLHELDAELGLLESGPEPEDGLAADEEADPRQHELSFSDEFESDELQS